MNEKMFIELFEYFENRQNEEIMEELYKVRQELDDLKQYLFIGTNDVQMVTGSNILEEELEIEF